MANGDNAVRAFHSNHPTARSAEATSSQRAKVRTER
jgi:hypothetical protein